MSSNDKTGDQLANTIRKAKTGTPSSPASTPAPSVAKPTAPTKKAPVAKKPAPAKKKAARPAAKKSAKSEPAVGSVQLGKRVWPD